MKLSVLITGLSIPNWLYGSLRLVVLSIKIYLIYLGWLDLACLVTVGLYSKMSLIYHIQ